MQPEILTVRDLSVTFRSNGQEVRAVDGISFSLSPGKTLGIVGESGSGKSVTALALMKLLPAPPALITAAAITFCPGDGTKLSLLEADLRTMRRIRGNRISMIFQEPMSSLNPVMRCGEQVDEAIRAHRKISRREARTRTLALFSETRLNDPEGVYHAFPHEISGGQKQRVMIAMAVASGPGILIADEPTTALDVTVQKSIVALLKDLQSRYGMALMFITHDLGLIAGIADDLAVMRNGKIVESGPAKTVLSNPRHPYTQALLACRPTMGKIPDRLPAIRNLEDPYETLNIRPKQRDEEQYREKLSAIYYQSPLMETRDLSLVYPGRRGRRHDLGVTALDSVTIDVYPGEVLGLVGESGCGKTTLGRTILRLVDPAIGRIIYNGINLTALTSGKLRKIRKEIQIIFQDPFASLNPLKTAGNTLLEAMKVHGIGKDSTERKVLALDLLEKTGLEPAHFDRYPHELSGGQRQRLSIARALSVRPRFIVCDESVSALDVSVQAQVLNLLKDIKKEFGLTYLFISHDLAVVRFISDRILIMKDGKIIETGSTEKIFGNPEQEYTRQLIEAASYEQQAIN